MRITLGLTVHDKEQIIESVLRSWLDHASGKHEIEIIACFDACHDASMEIANRVLDDYPQVDYVPIVTDDIFEIKCNNLELAHSTSDLIIFVQDDNWVYDLNWDETLVSVWQCFSDAGTVSLLSGVQMNRDFSLNRIECYRPHKDERAWVHGIPKDAYPLGVYEVDAINRPFSVRTETLRAYGGLDEAYCPMDYDDADLSFKLLRDGSHNYYAPYDLLNICAKKETLSQSTIAENFQRGERIARGRWGDFIAGRTTSVKLVAPMTVTDNGLMFTESEGLA